MILKKLPNHQFAAGCSDGSVHLWRLAANDQYQYHQQLDVGDDSDAHSLRVLAYENGRLFGEFNQFIVRWDASNGRLLDRMAYSSLRAILINAVIDLALDSNLNADNMILDIEWGLSNDYVFVCIDDTYRFLVKLFDEKVKPFFLGYQDHTKYKVTTAGDLVVLRDINGLELLAGWNKLTNTFSRRENLPFSNLTNCLIGADGRIFNWLEDVCKVYIYDPYQNRHAKLKLQIRDAQRFRALLVVLSNGDLLGKRRNGHLSIWDGKTGKLKNRNIGLPFYGSDVNELKNGDLLKTDKIHVHLHPVRATVVNIHRFGLRK